MVWQTNLCLCSVVSSVEAFLLSGSPSSRFPCKTPSGHRLQRVCYALNNHGYKWLQTVTPQRGTSELTHFLELSGLHSRLTLHGNANRDSWSKTWLRRLHCDLCQNVHIKTTATMFWHELVEIRKHQPEWKVATKDQTPPVSHFPEEASCSPAGTIWGLTHSWSVVQKENNPCFRNVSNHY